MLPCPFRNDACPDRTGSAECPFHLERLTHMLAEREEQLLGFWLHAGDIHCIVSTEGVFQRVSASCLALLGYEPEQMDGLAFVDFVHPDDVKQTRDMFRRSRNGQSVALDFRNRYKHKDGYYVPMEWISSEPSKGRLYMTARRLPLVDQPPLPVPADAFTAPDPQGVLSQGRAQAS